MGNIVTQNTHSCIHVLNPITENIAYHLFYLHHAWLIHLLKELFADRMHVSPCDPFWKSSICWQNARFTFWPFLKELFADRMHVSPCDPFWKSSSLTECTFYLVTLFERALFADRMHVSPSDPFWKSSIRWQNARFTLWPFLKELYSLTECMFYLVTLFERALFTDRMHVLPWPFLKELYSLTECTFHLVTLFERALFTDRMHVLPWPFLKELYSLTECTFHLVTLFERALFADRMHVSPCDPFWKSSIRWQNARFTFSFWKSSICWQNARFTFSFWKSSICWQNARFTFWLFLKSSSLTECTCHLVTLFERALFADRMHISPSDPFWKSSIRWQNARFTFWPFLKELYSLTECTFHLLTLFERALFADRMHVRLWSLSGHWFMPCYEPLIETFRVQNLLHIIIRNRCMSQGLNH